MATHVQHVRRVDDADVTADTTQVVNNDRVTEVVDDSPSVIAARVVWFIAGVILVILAFRFFFILAGANPSSGFVNFIYNISHPFAAPFFGIFGYEQNLGVGKFEFSTLVAMAVYALIAWGVARLLTIRHPRV
jgi:uncharacterized protein YggT (Ycf19 family)